MRVRSRIRFRRLRESDIETLMEIDAASFPSPWGRQLYRDDIGDAERGVHLVATSGRRPIGHAGVLFLGSVAHVSTVAVHADFVGTGVGTELVARLIGEAIAAGSEAMTLEVRTTNERAKALYGRFGFAPVGVRPGYYDDPGGRTDALIMWLHELGPGTEAKVEEVLAGRHGVRSAAKGANL